MRLTKTIKTYTVLSCAVFLTACSSFFDTDNTPAPTPLTNYTAEVSPRVLWTTSVGSGATGYDYLRMNPAVSGAAIYTASTGGTVTAVNKTNGRTLWQANVRKTLASGPGAGDGLVVVGAQNGEVIALAESNGAVRWKAAIPGEVIGNPAVGNGVVVVKAVDGYTRGLSADDGQERWAYQQVEPNLILRGASSPVIRDNSVIVGFANGSLAKLSVSDGGLSWVQTIAIPEGAFAIQRMIDIDADPVVYNHQIYAATYQGKISSLEWSSGQTLWTHDISSYTGMAADGDSVFISDAKGHVYSFGGNSGLVNWRQNKLEYRILSAPAVMGNTVVVGDGQGYLHWLSKTDGRFVGRASLGSAIYASPIVENNVLYALTNNGYLAAYTLR